MIRVIKNASELETNIPGIRSENAKRYYCDYAMDPWSSSEFMSSEEIQIGDNEYQIRFVSEIEFMNYGIDVNNITEIYTELVLLKRAKTRGQDHLYLVVRDKQTDIPIGVVLLNVFLSQEDEDGIPEFDALIDVSIGTCCEAYVVREIDNIRTLMGKGMINEASVVVAYNMVLALKELHVKLRLADNDKEFDINYEPTIDDLTEFVSIYQGFLKSELKKSGIVTAPTQYEKDIINLVDNIMNAVNDSEYVKWRKKHP